MLVVPFRDLNCERDTDRQSNGGEGDAIVCYGFREGEDWERGYLRSPLK